MNNLNRDKCAFCGKSYDKPSSKGYREAKDALDYSLCDVCYEKRRIKPMAHYCLEYRDSDGSSANHVYIFQGLYLTEEEQESLIEAAGIIIRTYGVEGNPGGLVRSEPCFEYDYKQGITFMSQSVFLDI